ncbi:MAG: hypothetical protein JWQ03_2961 [Variovorax sp.]|nr:hypothetical protein [Variovorax sp.]
MAQAAKTQQEKPLMLSPKALQKALADSARQAHRLAAAFGQKVPGVPIKTGLPQRKP